MPHDTKVPNDYLEQQMALLPEGRRKEVQAEADKIIADNRKRQAEEAAGK